MIYASVAWTYDSTVTDSAPLHVREQIAARDGKRAVVCAK
jgi:hypothetical protein